MDFNVYNCVECNAKLKPLNQVIEKKLVTSKTYVWCKKCDIAFLISEGYKAATQKQGEDK